MILSAWTEIGIGHFLGLGCLLFVLGLIVVLARRSPLAAWMGILMMLEAVVLDLCAFDQLGMVRREAGEGRAFSTLIIAAAAFQTALAVGVMVRLVQSSGSGDLDTVTSRLSPTDPIGEDH